MKYYILRDGEPFAVEGVLEWAAWFDQRHDRVVKQDELPGDVRVSTVFLGIDMRWGGGGPPILYETMVFGGPADGWQERSCTKSEALEVHGRALALAAGEGS